MAEQDQQQGVEQGVAKTGNGFIVGWTLLILFVMALAFVNRIFSYAGNPFALYLPILALVSATVSVLLLLVGYTVLMRGVRSKTSKQKRAGILFMITGLFMVASHFISKMVMPGLLG